MIIRIYKACVNAGRFGSPEYFSMLNSNNPNRNEKISPYGLILTGADAHEDFGKIQFYR